MLPKIDLEKAIAEMAKSDEVRIVGGRIELAEDPMRFRESHDRPQQAYLLFKYADGSVGRVPVTLTMDAERILDLMREEDTDENAEGDDAV